MVQQIDINADIGEGFGNYLIPNEEEIMKRITSANIACGYHAGDPVTMRKTVALAKKYGVAVGAHPGLPDLMGFGRRVMEISPEEIYDYIVYQVGALKAFAEIEGLTLHHVKPHGAFFRSTKAYEEQSRALVQAFLDIDPELLLYCPGPVDVYHLNLSKVAAATGLKIIPEFYADLNYTSSGALDQSSAKKLEATPEATAQRVLRFVKEGRVTSTEGTEVSFKASTICIHGDNPLTLERLQAIRHVLDEGGVTIRRAER
jgi:UPF0271 protein